MEKNQCQISGINSRRSRTSNIFSYLFLGIQICSDSVATLRKKAKSIEDIYTVDQYIDEYYYGSYDEEIIVDQALKGMVSALDDKYYRLYDS